jgi:hypothetical protein
LISSIEPNNKANPGFLQIYVVGTGGTDEAKHRIQKAQGPGSNSGVASKMSLLTKKRLMNLTYKVNPYAQVYKLARTVL